MMETQPAKQEQVPVVPPPQTVEGYMSSMLTNPAMPTDLPPGSTPNAVAMLSRLYLEDTLEFTTDTSAGTRLSSYFPLDVASSRHIDGYDEIIQRPYKFLSAHSVFYNSTVTYTFYAIKPALVTGRIGFFYYPASGPYGNRDNPQRSILKEWDLAGSPICAVTLPGVLSSNHRPTDIQPQQGPDYLDNQNNGFCLNSSGYSTLASMDISYGRLDVVVLSRLQVGSIFPPKIRLLA